jgi:hypothetical protein
VVKAAERPFFTQRACQIGSPLNLYIKKELAAQSNRTRVDGGGVKEFRNIASTSMPSPSKTMHSSRPSSQKSVVIDLAPALNSYAQHATEKRGKLNIVFADENSPPPSLSSLRERQSGQSTSDSYHSANKIRTYPSSKGTGSSTTKPLLLSPSSSSSSSSGWLMKPSKPSQSISDRLKVRFIVDFFFVIAHISRFTRSRFLSLSK